MSVNSSICLIDFISAIRMQITAFFSFHFMTVCELNILKLLQVILSGLRFVYSFLDIEDLLWQKNFLKVSE